jgi:predicted amidohydrolase YtcJ
MIIRNAEVEDVVTDVELGQDIGAGGGAEIGEEIDAGGGALIPGPHDHHLHLHAMAAALQSIDMHAFLRGERAIAGVHAPPIARSGDWLRVVGYHESLHGDVDRDALDRLCPHQPVRVQHASGAMWVVNSIGLRLLGDDTTVDGRLYGRDAWLHERLGGEAPDLATVAARLAAVGVTGVTDATPGPPRKYDIALDVHVLGYSKIVVADHDPPSVDDLVDAIRAVRPAIAAFHCASRLGLVLTLAALEIAGARQGDRIEHGAVIPDDAVGPLRALGLTVVTQPAFVHERGDRYLADVDPDDRPYLWRCGSLLRAGIPVLGSSDAPHGPADPWAAMRAAVGRRTSSDQPIGPDERITPRQALALFAPPVGAPFGWCLLHVPLAEALAAPDASYVRRTLAPTKLKAVTQT